MLTKSEIRSRSSEHFIANFSKRNYNRPIYFNFLSRTHHTHTHTHITLSLSLSPSVCLSLCLCLCLSVSHFLSLSIYIYIHIYIYIYWLIKKVASLKFLYFLSKWQFLQGKDFILLKYTWCINELITHPLSHSLFKSIYLYIYIYIYKDRFTDRSISWLKVLILK